MRLPALLSTAVLVAASFLPETAQAKDKMIFSMVNGEPTNANFVQCQSQGLAKIVGTKMQIQLKKLENLPDTDGVPCSGDEYICVITSEVSLGVPSFATSYTFFQGDLKKGSLKLKHDMCKENSTLCGTGVVSTTTGLAIQCYEPDPSWPLPAFNAAGTAGSGAVNSCEGVQLSLFGVPTLPTSAVIAELGMSQCP